MISRLPRLSLRLSSGPTRPTTRRFLSILEPPRGPKQQPKDPALTGEPNTPQSAVGGPDIKAIAITAKSAANKMALGTQHQLTYESRTVCVFVPSKLGPGLPTVRFMPASSLGTEVSTAEDDSLCQLYKERSYDPNIDILFVEKGELAAFSDSLRDETITPSIFDSRHLALTIPVYGAVDYLWRFLSFLPMLETLSIVVAKATTENIVDIHKEIPVPDHKDGRNLQLRKLSDVELADIRVQTRLWIDHTGAMGTRWETWDKSLGQYINDIKEESVRIYNITRSYEEREAGSEAGSLKVKFMACNIVD
jgi:hypothetical protein